MLKGKITVDLEVNMINYYTKLQSLEKQLY